MKHYININEVNFCYPIPKFPYYHAKIKVTNNSSKDCYIDKILMNNTGTRDFLIFLNNKLIYEPIIKANSFSWIIARIDWENNDQILIKIKLKSIDNKIETCTIKENYTPNYGGFWNKNWKYYFSVVVTERDGLTRNNGNK